jgi:phosphoserine phosphatase
MLKTKILSACLLSMLLAGVARAETALQHWPPAVAARLEAAIKQHANSGAFAVFDADNTTYNNDLEESLLPFMEAKGALSRDKLPLALQPIPFKDIDGHKESLNSYYYRLCEVDDQVCYPWVAQVFSGFTLRELKAYVDEMLAAGKTIPATYYETTKDGTTVKTIDVKPPKFYTGRQELYNKLMENGIEVYVVSAASEELVRMVLADPKYGYNIKPQNVIGVGLQLKDRKTGMVTNARKLITAKTYDPAALQDHELTAALWAPMTWFEGKPAAILTYIDPWKRPMLVAGDTPVSDGPMLFRAADVEHGGVRVWVNRKDKYMVQIEAMQKSNAAAQKAQGLAVTADREWLVVKPEQIQ